MKHQIQRCEDSKKRIILLALQVRDTVSPTLRSSKQYIPAIFINTLGRTDGVQEVNGIFAIKAIVLNSVCEK